MLPEPGRELRRLGRAAAALEHAQRGLAVPALLVEARGLEHELARLALLVGRLRAAARGLLGDHLVERPRGAQPVVRLGERLGGLPVEGALRVALARPAVIAGLLEHLGRDALPPGLVVAVGRLQPLALQHVDPARGLELPGPDVERRAAVSRLLQRVADLGRAGEVLGLLEVLDGLLEHAAVEAGSPASACSPLRESFAAARALLAALRERPTPVASSLPLPPLLAVAPLAGRSGPSSPRRTRTAAKSTAAPTPAARSARAGPRGASRARGRSSPRAGRPRRAARASDPARRARARSPAAIPKPPSARSGKARSRQTRRNAVGTRTSGAARTPSEVASAGRRDALRPPPPSYTAAVRPRGRASPCTRALRPRAGAPRPRCRPAPTTIRTPRSSASRSPFGSGRSGGRRPGAGERRSVAVVSALGPPPGAAARHLAIERTGRRGRARGHAVVRDAVAFQASPTSSRSLARARAAPQPADRANLGAPAASSSRALPALPLPAPARGFVRLPMLDRWDGSTRASALLPAFDGLLLLPLDGGAPRRLAFPLYAFYYEGDPSAGVRPGVLESFVTWPELASGDDDGDGRADVFALSRYDVAVYRGGPDGLPPAADPARRNCGPSRTTRSCASQAREPLRPTSTATATDLVQHKTFGTLLHWPRHDEHLAAWAPASARARRPTRASRAAAASAPSSSRTSTATAGWKPSSCSSPSAPCSSCARC